MSCPICDHHKTLAPEPQTSAWILRPAPGEKNLPGYFYLETRRHLPSFFALGAQEWAELGSKLSEVQALYQAMEPLPEKVYLCALAEKVPHFHIHIVPRYAGQDPGIPHLDTALTKTFPLVGEIL